MIRTWVRKAGGRLAGVSGFVGVALIAAGIGLWLGVSAALIVLGGFFLLGAWGR